MTRRKHRSAAQWKRIIKNWNKTMEMPDFTKGDTIPEGADHDWNLGAIGTRGWMYSDKMSMADARQIYITKVEKNSPADGILQGLTP